jgi:hypothetical protein
MFVVCCDQSCCSGGIFDQQNITARDNASFFVVRGGRALSRCGITTIGQNVVDATNNPIEGNDARISVQQDMKNIVGVKCVVWH